MRSRETHFRETPLSMAVRLLGGRTEEVAYAFSGADDRLQGPSPKFSQEPLGKFISRLGLLLIIATIPAVLLGAPAWVVWTTFGAGVGIPLLYGIVRGFLHYR